LTHKSINLPTQCDASVFVKSIVYPGTLHTIMSHPILIEFIYFSTYYIIRYLHQVI